MHVPRSLPKFALAALALCAALVSRGAETTERAEQLLAVINSYRASAGLEALTLDPVLQTIAAEHSAGMAARKRLSHDGFAARFDRSGADLCVENVAHGSNMAPLVLDGWKRVSTHRGNLLDPNIRRAGIALDGVYVTYFACQ